MTRLIEGAVEDGFINLLQALDQLTQQFLFVSTNKIQAKLFQKLDPGLEPCQTYRIQGTTFEPFRHLGWLDC